MGARIATTTASGVLAVTSLQLDQFMAKKFVETLESRLVVLQLADREIAPEMSGTQVRWQYFDNPSGATTALTEGADPSTSTTISTNVITGVLREFGAYFELSKLFMKASTSGTMEAIAERAGYQAALTVDTLCQTLALQDTTTITNVGASLAAENIRTIASSLEGSDVMPHPATPGGQFYAGIFLPADAYDMMGEGAPTWFQAKSTDYRDALQTPFRDSPANAAVYNVMIKTSTNMQTSGSDNVGYVLGGNSFGALSYDSDLLNPTLIRTPPEALVSAPVRNRGTIGWHVMFDAAHFDSNRVNEVLSDT